MEFSIFTSLERRRRFRCSKCGPGCPSVTGDNQMKKRLPSLGAVYKEANARDATALLLDLDTLNARAGRPTCATRGQLGRGRRRRPSRALGDGGDDGPGSEMLVGDRRARGRRANPPRALRARKRRFEHPGQLGRSPPPPRARRRGRAGPRQARRFAARSDLRRPGARRRLPIAFPCSARYKELGRRIWVMSTGIYKMR